MDQASSLRDEVNRQNLIKARPQRTKTRVIAVTSGKGGTGKSNVSVNLSVWLRKMGKRVIILDADVGLANVEVMFNVIPRYNLSDFLYGDREITEIVTKGPMDIGFISGGSGILSLNHLDHERIHFLIENLSGLDGLCDYLIIDTGAGISDSVLDFVAASPEVLLVVTPDPGSLTDSYSLIKALYNHPDFRPDSVRIGLLANRVGSVQEGSSVYDRLNTVVDRFLHGNLNYIGCIPRDPKLEKAVRTQRIVSLEYPEAKSSRCFQRVAEILSGQGTEKNGRPLSDFFRRFLRR